MAFKVLLCSGDDASLQHWSVLRAIPPQPPQNYICLLRGLLLTEPRGRRRAQGLMRGTRGPFLPALAIVMMVVGGSWLLGHVSTV